MKVVLLKDIKNLGVWGDVCEVGDGYALNFLIPRQDAVFAADAQAKSLLQKKAGREQKREHDVVATREMLANMSSVVTVRVPANDLGTLFQAITPAVLCEHLTDSGGGNVTIPAQWFSFSPIKEVGKHIVTVSPGNGDSRDITVTVEREQ